MPSPELERDRDRLPAESSSERNGSDREVTTVRPSVVTTQPTLPNPAPYVSRTRRWALVLVLVVSFVGAAWVAAPLWVAILIGVVLAVSTQRAFARLVLAFGERHAQIAAGLVTLATGGLVLVVGSGIVVTLANELVYVVGRVREYESTGAISGLLGERAARSITDLGVDTTRLSVWLRQELEAAASYAARLAAVVFQTTSYAVLGIVVALVTMYYVLLDGPGLARRIERIAPLEPRHTRALLVEARNVGRTAFLGTLATAAVQGLLAGIGYAMFGVSQPILWGVVTAVGSFVPIIGTALVWAPIAGFLLIDGEPVRAVLLLLWGVLVITSLADYVIRPKIVGSHGGHPLLTLIALLGGIQVFGLVGLIIAPIVMSLFVAALRLYEREVPSQMGRVGIVLDEP